MADPQAPLLADAAEAQRKYAQAEIELADLRALRARAFRACRDAGCTYRQIAAVAGLTFQRIRDIVDPRPPRKTPAPRGYRDIEI